MEVFTVKETMKILKISRCTLMGLLESKKIRSVRAGARWIIPAEAIKNYLQGA